MKKDKGRWLYSHSFLYLNISINMEKLLGLLNEYDPYIASDGEHRDNLWGYAYQWHSAVFPKELAESYIISARYGFIKWLVDNDKIKPLRKFIGWETDEDEPYIQFDLVDQYIAYLSISDTPIEDLISYLK